MQVRISAVEREFRNTYPGVKSMFTWIDESMKESRDEFSHLVVDGVEVHEEARGYLKKKLKDVNKIEVVFSAKKPARRQKKAVKSASGVQTDVLHVRISNLDFTVEKTTAGVDEMFSRIDEAMQEFQVYFSHLLVDGKELRVENPRAYCEDNFTKIEEIDVCFLTAEQFFQQVMQIMDNFLLNSLPTLKVIADDLYGSPDDETWRHFDANIEGIASMLQLINSLVALKELSGSTAIFNVLGESITIHLENLKNAAKLGDYTMMADILHFEIVPFMYEMQTAVSNMLRRYGNVTH